MRSLALADIKKFELKDTLLNRNLKPHEILLRVAYAGVCGSDIHYYKEGKIGDQVIDFPFVIGHEFSALVEKTGSNVNKFKPGDRVTVDPAVSCGNCSQCRAGRYHTCENLEFLGCPGQLEGCYTDYMVMPEKNCFLLPHELDLKAGAFVEPLSIGYYAVSFLKDIKVNSIAILGAGPIGMSVFLSAKDMGIHNMYITDKINNRLKLAKNMGAKWVGNPDESNIVEEIISSGYPDAVFECCGKQEAINQAVDILTPGGTLILVGIPSVDFISFNISKIRRKELIIRNVRRQNESVQQAIQVALKSRDEIDKMITHIYSPDQVQKAFDTVENYKDGVLKALIKFSDS